MSSLGLVCLIVGDASASQNFRLYLIVQTCITQPCKGSWEFYYLSCHITILKQNHGIVYVEERGKGILTKQIAELPDICNDVVWVK